MELDDLIIAVYCLIDESLPEVLAGQQLRQSGPDPKLTDGEVLTMEVVGEYLGLDRDTALFAYTGLFFPVCAFCIELPSPVRPPSCGLSRSDFGALPIPPSRMIQPTP